MPLKVDAVVFYRVVDPSVWVTRVKNGYQATHTLAQTTLRATLGAHTLTDILTQRTGIAKRMEVSETLPLTLHLCSDQRAQRFTAASPVCASLFSY